MTCEELVPDYPAYALGILDDPERAEISGHLARKCPECVEGVVSALATVAVLSAGAAVSEPPPALRRRVLGMVGATPQRWWGGLLLPWAAAGALALGLLFSWTRDRAQDGNTARLAQALAIMNDPATRDVTFGESEKPARGRVFVSPGHGVVFMGASLPRPGSGKTFELWVIPAGGKPVAAGTFSGEADATAVYIYSGPVARNLAAVAVTIEPESGSPQPTSKPFIVAGLS